MAIGALGLIVIIAASLYFAFRFVEQERQRDLQSWQVRMGIVADSRTSDLADWVEQNFGVMRELAENASLQLYLSMIVASEAGAQAPEDTAETGYLRNLLTATASRSGFVPPARPAEVSANVERAGEAGIALTDSKGQLIVGTPGMPPLPPQVRTAVAKALSGEASFVDVYLGATNLPTVGFVLPVLSVQASSATDAVGAVVGLRVVGADLYKRLEQPGEVEKTAESILLRKAGATVEHLSPLRDGTDPLGRTMALDTPDLAAAFAVNVPGGFGVKKDYAGKEVLVTSRPVKGTPWILMRSVTTAETLAETETRGRTILIVFVLIIVGVSVAMIAVWRHGTSVRAAEAAVRFKQAADRFENLSTFMKVVTDGQPTGIVTVNAEGVYSFANKAAADDVGSTPEDMLGKTMSAVIGPVKAHALMDVNREVLLKGERMSSSHTFDEPGGGFRVLKCEHIPLKGDRDQPPSVLMIIEDVTAVVRERERRENVLKQLTNTLVSVVDRRDPYSAHHSERVAEVASSIASEMGLDPVATSTVGLAGRLMNVGKIFIPAELLTKSGQLTPEERELLARSFVVSGELLDGVDFDGPVVETIREIGEFWDGTGPLQIQGENILITSRIVAVANTFVGMVSPRAWRDPLTFDKVSEILFSQTGKKYDRRAVLALMNVLENRDGKKRWAYFREKTPD
ncbi:MAG: PAS domain-containing protein [Alphaproteobacteria bacterium]|nr:PAS domain-containing protein [Alphaproteobacteria bacterium]